VAAASTGRSIGVEQQTGHSKHSLSGVFFIHNNHYIRAGRVLQSFGDPEHRASGRASTPPTLTTTCSCLAFCLVAEYCLTSDFCKVRAFWSHKNALRLSIEQCHDRTSRSRSEAAKHEVVKVQYTRAERARSSSFARSTINVVLLARPQRGRSGRRGGDIHGGTDVKNTSAPTVLRRMSKPASSGTWPARARTRRTVAEDDGEAWAPERRESRGVREQRVQRVRRVPVPRLELRCDGSLSSGLAWALASGWASRRRSSRARA
jgi:hypothetical protein